MQRQLLSLVDGLKSQAPHSAARVQWPERQLTVHSAELASTRGDMNRFEESVTVALGQLPDTQPALITVEGEGDEHCRRLGVEEQRRGSLESLLLDLRCRLVDHTSLVDWV